MVYSVGASDETVQAPVVELRNENAGAVIVHRIACAQPPQVGQAVSLRVDEAARRLHARLHSAGHALDAAMRTVGRTDLVPSKGYHFPDNPNVGESQLCRRVSWGEGPTRETTDR